MKRALLGACACLAASFWTACSTKTTPLTQIVVAVDSDWDGFVRAEIAIDGFEKKPALIQANLSRASARRVALIHDGGPLGLKALYKKCKFPEPMYPAFRVAIDAFHERPVDNTAQDRERFTKLVIERILTKYREIETSDLDFLLAKLAKLHAA